MLGVYETLPDAIQEVDIVIAGGGTAACVVAGRLAEADRNLSILVVEQGPNNYGVPTIVHPALLLSALAPTSNATLFYKGIEEPQLKNRALIVPSGGTLGGGSSINLMMYSRAQRSDFDAWNVPGWTTNDMIPYLKKLESYHGPGSKQTHGTEGPIAISGAYRCKRSEDDFAQAATKLGYTELDDITALDAINGFQRTMRYVGLDGTRQDTASRYLHPKLQRSEEYPNLHVLVDSPVNRVLFDDADDEKRASGVEFYSKADPTRLRTVRARKLVIVSAGALGTPSILERSGIGNPEILRNAGVNVVVDLPGVGENYQDHHLLVYAYYSALEPHETLDALVSGRVDVQQLIKEKAEMLRWNAMDIAFKIRPSDAEVAALGPEFEAFWEKEYQHNTNKPLALGSLINGFPGDPTNIPPGQYLSMSTFTPYPVSRGSIHITSATLTPTSPPPTFKTGFLTSPLDVKPHIWLYKTQRAILRRMSLYRGELPALHPPFPASSAAKCVKLDAPLPHTDVEIAYSDDDDKVIEEWVRDKVETTWHSLGTCRMGRREEGGVVDGASLGVHGVKGLKVVDLSVCPGNVAANTMNTAVGVAERGADFVKGELGLV